MRQGRGKVVHGVEESTQPDQGGQIEEPQAKPSMDRCNQSSWTREVSLKSLRDLAPVVQCLDAAQFVGNLVHLLHSLIYP
jgi:hypothetical protein